MPQTVYIPRAFGGTLILTIIVAASSVLTPVGTIAGATVPSGVVSMSSPGGTMAGSLIPVGTIAAGTGPSGTIVASVPTGTITRE